MRTIQEIYDEIIIEMRTFNTLSNLQPNIHDSQTFLQKLTTTSRVSIWHLYIWVHAFAIWIHEFLFEEHKKTVELRATEIIVGPLPWYRKKSFEFQLGDTLQLIDGENYQYAIIDVSKQIIKRSAAIDAGGQVRLKVAKLQGNLPIPLTQSEKNSFLSYINKIKIAGTNVAVISEPSDLLKLSYDIFYDPLVLKTNGESILNPGTFPVEDAINNHISNLPFNGVLTLTFLTDSIQQVEGVIDPRLISASAKSGNIPYLLIDKEYNAVAGHLVIDTNFPLNTSLNYIEVV